MNAALDKLLFSILDRLMDEAKRDFGSPAYRHGWHPLRHGVRIKKLYRMVLRMDAARHLGPRTAPTHFSVSALKSSCLEQLHNIVNAISAYSKLLSIVLNS